MQIYISKIREKQLRDYATSHSVSMSSIIDKSLDLYINKGRNDEAIPTKINIPTPAITPVSKPVPVPAKKGDWGFEL